MAEVIKPYGELVGLCGYDGSNWEKVLIDATKRLVVAIAASELPDGAAIAAHQLTQITALQSIQNLVGALHDVGLDELDVNLVGNVVKAGVKQHSLAQYIYNDTPGDTNAHALMNISTTGMVVGIDFCSDDPASSIRVTVDSDHIHSVAVNIPSTYDSWALDYLNLAGGESAWAKIGVYDTVNDYYSMYLKRPFMFKDRMELYYIAGSATAKIGLAIQFRGIE